MFARAAIILGSVFGEPDRPMTSRISVLRATREPVPLRIGSQVAISILRLTQPPLQLSSFQ
jgi:hypothetical protein